MPLVVWIHGGGWRGGSNDGLRRPGLILEHGGYILASVDYLNPPNHAVVLFVDEKSQVQALDRTQRALPMDLGYVEGFTL